MPQTVRLSAGAGALVRFSGLSSMRSTTTALVRDFDMSVDELRSALHGALVLAGYLAEELDDDTEADLAAELRYLLDIAAEFEVGAVVERRFDVIRIRTA